MTYDTINDAQTIAGNGEGTLLANRYRVVRQLGQGGMGSVWLAEDTQLDNKPFAIKMLPSILVANKRAYRQLKDEALVAMKLTHPNIVTLRAFEENNGNPFLVMDYIDGQTLDDYLAEHTGTTGVSPVATGLPEADVLRILRPIAAALDYAHSEGVVHRDVKPANVMIRKDGHPYILDFGVAREIQETLTRVTGKLSCGTLLYMSPEQLRGQSPKPAQDIYSFAAMVYECLTGEPPFVRGQIEFQILNEQPESPPGGTQLVASVMSGLAKKPEDRPPTCAAVLEGNGLSRVEHVECVESVDASVPRARSVEVPLLKSVTSTHNKVQLWEGGPYWADTNIGAENPWESGYYFWWGDTVGYKCGDNICVASDGSSSAFKFNKENTQTYGKNICTVQREEWIVLGEQRKSFFGKLFGLREDSVLTSDHDAAHVHWGGGWRMPTRQELNDLCKKCSWIWAPKNGVNGYIVCGRGEYASANIFLPAAGYGNETSLYSSGSSGYYWSSVPDSGNGDYAWRLHFNSGYHYAGSYCRYYGRSVRPVQGFTK